RGCRALKWRLLPELRDFSDLHKLCLIRRIVRQNAGWYIVKSVLTIRLHADVRCAPGCESALLMAYADAVSEDESYAEPFEIRLHHDSLGRQQTRWRF